MLSYLEKYEVLINYVNILYLQIPSIEMKSKLLGVIDFYYRMC
jgi:hypothetical protein